MYYRVAERALVVINMGVWEIPTCIQRLNDAHSALILEQQASFWNSGGGKINICVTHRTDRMHCVL